MCLDNECTKCRKKCHRKDLLDVTIGFYLCKKCEKKYAKKLLDQIFKLVQPERLNPEGAKPGASNSLNSTNRKRSRGRSEEVSPPTIVCRSRK